MSKADKIAALKAKILKESKGIIIQDARESKSAWKFLRRPFGLAKLDIATKGGLPPGGATHIYGMPGVGKSTLMFLAMKMNQILHGDDSCIFIGVTELGLAKAFARTIGFMVGYNDEELEEMEDTTNEKLSDEEREHLKFQIGHVEEVRSKTAGDLLDTIVTLTESNEFQLGGLDSIGSFLTSETDAGSVEDRNYGPAAMNARFITKLSSTFLMPNKEGVLNSTALIVINQVRANVGGGAKRMSWGSKPDVTFSGGYALRHGYMLNIFLWKGAMEKTEITLDDNSKEELVTGYNVHWEVQKAKCDCHEGQRGEFTMNWAQENTLDGIYPGPDTIKDAIMAGNGLVVFQKGAGWTWPSVPGDLSSEPYIKSKSTRKFIQAINEAGAFPELYNQVMRTNGIKVKNK